MPKTFDEIKNLFPRLQGLVDSKVERELFLAFHRVYEYVNSEIKTASDRVTKENKIRTEDVITQTSQLVNNFVTKLITGKGQGNNPLETLGVGTVTSIAATGNLLFSISGSPITENGTFSFTLSNQSANRIFAGPTTGAAASPTFRAIVKEDINIPFKLTTSTAADPTTTEYVNGTWGIHKNTISGDVFVAYNDGGVIKKVLLS